MKVFTFISVHAWETNTYARVNLLEMSTYKSCWRWPVSQFSIWNRGIDFKIPRLTGSQLWTGSPLDQRTVHRLTDRQMYTFPDQRNWQFVQILMYSKFHSKLRVLDTDDVKQKTSLFSVQGKSAWYCFKAVVLLFYVICVRYPSITWIDRECKAQNGLIL